MRRVNFTADLVGDLDRPGIRDLVERLKSQGESSPENVVDSCLDLMGPLEVNRESRDELIGYIEEGGDFGWGNADQVEASMTRVSELLQLIVAIREYQYA